MSQCLQVLPEASMTSQELSQVLIQLAIVCSPSKGLYNIHFPFKLFSHRGCHLFIKVLLSSAFIAAICCGYSRRWKDICFISSANMSIGIVFANTSTASSDTVLKSLIYLIALRRYTDNNFLVVRKENASDLIGQAYNIINVTTLDIILLLNGFGPRMFAYSSMDFRCFLKSNLLSIITPKYFIALLDSILVAPTDTSMLSTIFRPLIKAAYGLCASSVKPASSSQALTS